jgi:hypothetical protein
MPIQNIKQIDTLITIKIQKITLISFIKSLVS